MDLELKQEIKDLVKKEKLPTENVCQDETEIKTESLELISPDYEQEIKKQSLLRRYQLQNDKLMIENTALLTDDKLKMLFAKFIIWLLAIQTITIFAFLFKFSKLFNTLSLTSLIAGIVGQSYFLPSFLAKYLFKNDGVKIE